MNGLVWRCATGALGVAAGGALAFGGLVLAQPGTATAAATAAQTSMSYDGGDSGGGGGTSGGTTIVVDKPAGGGSGGKAHRCLALHTDGNTLVKWAQGDEAAGDHASALTDAKQAAALFDQARKEGCPGT